MSDSERPTIEDIVRTAGEWVPTLRARSGETEELRRIPDATIAEFKAHGFHRIAQPERYGGWGLGPNAIDEFALEIGRGCPSTCWMAGQWPGHNFMIGMFSEQAQDELWSANPDMLSSTASAVVHLTEEVVPGGMKVSGKLKFSSGVDAAEWLLLLAKSRECLVPRSAFEIEDDWHVSGLRGTGSKTVVFEDVFVPDYRTIPVEQLMTGTYPGRELYPEYPYYKLPMGPMLNTMLLSSCIGTARGLIELFEERALTRIDGHTGEPAYQRPGTQMRFAEATAKVDAAMLILRRVLHDFLEYGTAGAGLPLEVRARIRRDIVWAAKIAIEAGNTLLEQGDASGQYDHQLVQRWGRDLHMAGLQMALTPDEPMMSYARVRWGLEPSSVFT